MRSCFTFASLVLVAGASVQAALVPFSPPTALNVVTYNPTTGNITIDTTVAATNVTGFRFGDTLPGAPGDIFAGGDAATFPAGSFSTTDSATVVSYASVSGGFAPGVYNLGNIAMTGLTEADLLASMADANTYYLGAATANVKQDWRVQVVPEPTTLGLLAVLMLSGRRRRRE
jgi:hypothetical protein